MFNVGLANNQTRVADEAGALIKWKDVDATLGQDLAYSADTGRFTAPVDGSYFFAVTTRTAEGSLIASSSVDVVAEKGDVEVEICKVDAVWAGDVGSCQGIVRLRKGHTVHVKTTEDDPSLAKRVSRFTGFLIDTD